MEKIKVRAFLSHSSKDKGIVQSVAEKLKTFCTYDSFDFEIGKKTLDEILRYIKNNGLFVFFISENSLNSEWVKKELKLFHQEMKQNNLKRILPILIDDNIKYNDSRIPKWLQNEYNIRPIKSSEKIVNLIKAELFDIYREVYGYEGYNNIFIGRNEIITKLEQQFYSNLLPQISYFACGMDGIGRRSLLLHFYNKIDLIKSKEIPYYRITLELEDSIEDFILKILDLDIIPQNFNYNEFQQKNLNEKFGLLKQLLIDLSKEINFLFVIDNGCLVLPDRNLNNWFEKLFSDEVFIKNIKRPFLNVIAKYRLNSHYNVKNKDIMYSVNVNELSKDEVRQLIIYILRKFDLDLHKEDINFLLNLLSTGHPKQIIYTMELLRENNMKYLKENAHLITEYNSNNVNKILLPYFENENAKNLLMVLSLFEYISFSTLDEIFRDIFDYYSLLNEFITKSICEEIGYDGEVIKISKSVNDFVKRTNWKLNEVVVNKLKKIVDEAVEQLKDNKLIDYDKFNYSMIETIKNNLSESVRRNSNFELFLPSQLLKAIIKLYDKGKWKEVITLGEKILHDRINKIDIQIENQIRKFLCLAYIRRGEDEKFKKEVQKIKDSTHEFLFGFYYRKKGEYTKALEKIKQSLEKNPNFIKAKRELVQIYLNLYDFETALELARENYFNYPEREYLFQAYSNCLIKTFHINTPEKKKELEDLFNLFEKYKELSDKHKEMYDMEYAKFLSILGKEEALEKIDMVIDEYPESIHPKLAKFDIADKLDNINIMEQALIELEKLKDRLPNKNILIIYKAILLTHQGKKELALNEIIKLKSYNDKYKEKLKKRLGLLD